MRHVADISVEYTYQLNGQDHQGSAKVNTISLRNGKEIPKRFFDLIAGNIDVNGVDPKEAGLRNLVDRGMPSDLHCWIMTIDGEAIDQSNYIFQFIGVVAKDFTSRPDAVSTRPMVIELVNNDQIIPMLLGFLWQCKAIWKESDSYCVETYAPNAPVVSELSESRFRLIAHVNPVIPMGARADTLRHLARGYELMSKLWQEVSLGPGRPPGTGWFSSTEDFTTALKDVLALFSKRPTQLDVLIKLDVHKLCQTPPKKPRTQSDTALLRKWIKSARLGNFDSAISKYFTGSQ